MSYKLGVRRDEFLTSLRGTKQTVEFILHSSSYLEILEHKP